MARIEWVKQRLENWALWVERGGDGARGFYTSSSFTWEAVDTSGYRDVPIPVDEVEAAQTDLAVQALRVDKGHLHRTIEVVYLEGESIRRAALKLYCAESTVKARLEQIDHEIATWLRTKREADERRARVTGSFTP